MTIKTYEALPGVEWVNGQPVPKNREIELTAEEALFDLQQGRIQVKKTVDTAPRPEADRPVVEAGKAKG